jgi:hypothetical protein
MSYIIAVARLLNTVVNVANAHPHASSFLILSLSMGVFHLNSPCYEIAACGKCADVVVDCFHNCCTLRQEDQRKLGLYLFKAVEGEIETWRSKEQDSLPLLDCNGEWFSAPWRIYNRKRTRDTKSINSVQYWSTSRAESANWSAVCWPIKATEKRVDG